MSCHAAITLLRHADTPALLLPPALFASAVLRHYAMPCASCRYAIDATPPLPLRLLLLFHAIADADIYAAMPLMLIR